MHSAMTTLMAFVGLVLLSLHLNTLPACHAATDTISSGQDLTGNSKIVSSNGRFALGFFQTESNTPKWYLGIWFYTVPKFTPVWIANGANPVANLTSCRLVLSHDGNLVLLDDHHQENNGSTVVWSSKAKATTTNNTTVATLLGNGNLVLRSSTSNASNNIFWQSFDHPTNTLLQGGKIGWDNATGLIRRLVSTKNTVDQSPGVYSFEMLVSNNGDTSFLSIFNSSAPYWSSGNWDGRHFSNIPETVGQTWLSLNFTSNAKERYIEYTIEDPTVLSRCIIDVSGQLKVLVWFEGSRDWQGIYTAPKSQCNVYASCGPFTVCNDVPFPSCTCMKGYSVRSPREWELDDRTGGCARDTPLSCSSSSNTSTAAGSGMDGDKFYPMPSVQLPADAQNVGGTAATSEDECSLTCLRNCSCTAYSYDEAAGCSIWHGELLNVRQQQGNSVLHLRLAAKELQDSSKSNSRKQVTIIGAAVGATAATLGLIITLVIIIWMRKGKRCRHYNLQDGMGVIAFGYMDLQNATNKFSEKLGAGSFGSVFKGSLNNGSTTIAVKRLDGARQGEKQFRAEVNSIGVIQHVNLVKLIGFCCQGDRRLLVYEHMPNGSLDSHLFLQNSGTQLNWTTRYQIALGVARGLAYLHAGCRDCIIHCDIKPENILLDGSFTPKVADFGMAKLLGRDFSQVVTTMRGTVGYLAPEWISGTAITSKVDVYSYGMVLFEMVSGRRNSSKQQSSHDGGVDYEAYFPVQVMRSLLNGDIANLVDPNLQGGEVDLEEVERVCKVACWCIQDVEFDRPTMMEVVQVLEGLCQVKAPPMPKLLQAIVGQTASRIM